jgi:hypothetical protein
MAGGSDSLDFEWELISWGYDQTLARQALI